MENIKKKINWRQYLLTFVIAGLIFGLGFWVSADLDRLRLSQVNNLRQDLQLDVLSAETQFSLLSSSVCQHIDSSALTSELYSMGQRLDYMESALGNNNQTVIRLKKQYSLLEIKQWQLTKKAQQQCQAEIIPILYFYSNKKDCPTCNQQGYVLTYLRSKYPFLRVYSFDANLDLSAIETLKSLFSLKNELPAIVINDKPYYGFRDREAVEKILPKAFNTLKKNQEGITPAKEKVTPHS